MLAEPKAFIPKTGRSAGVASTRWAAKLGGITASTFDSRLGATAIEFNGKQVYATIEKNGTFYNLLGVKPA